jgi:hypothetical protein
MPGHSPITTKFVSRGRLRGVLRERPAMRRVAGSSQPSSSSGDTRPAEAAAFDEALYYRARLILGEALPRPGR